MNEVSRVRSFQRLRSVRGFKWCHLLPARLQSHFQGMRWWGGWSSDRSERFGLWVVMTVADQTCSRGSDTALEARWQKIEDESADEWLVTFECMFGFSDSGRSSFVLISFCIYVNTYIQSFCIYVYIQTCCARWRWIEASRLMSDISVCLFL